MDNPLEETFEECGVILRGHFQLSSDRHSDTYIEKANLYKYPNRAYDMCFELAMMAGSIYDGFVTPMIQVVVGPVAGGIVLAVLTAYHLQEHYQEPVTSLFTEKDSQGKHVFNRGYAKELKGKNVLIVDDVITSVGTVRRLLECVRVLGGNVLGIAAMVIRKEDLKEIAGVPVHSLMTIPLPDWPAEDCYLCQDGVPLDPK